MSDKTTTPASEADIVDLDAEAAAEVAAYRANLDSETQPTAEVTISAERGHVGVSLPEIVFGWIAILAWLVLLTSGLIVNSKPHRDVISGAHEWTTDKDGDVIDSSETIAWTFATAWIVVLASYTFPNLALLSCIAAIVGGFCRKCDHTRSCPQAATPRQCLGGWPSSLQLTPKLPCEDLSFI